MRLKNLLLGKVWCKGCSQYILKPANKVTWLLKKHCNKAWTQKTNGVVNDYKIIFCFRVFFLDVSLDTILERITEQRTDPQTGQKHHLHFNPPATIEAMKRLCINPKHEPDVVKEKVADYCAYEEELSDFYRKNGVHVNADQDSYTVFEIIQSILVHPVPKKFSSSACL